MNDVAVVRCGGSGIDVAVAERLSKGDFFGTVPDIDEESGKRKINTIHSA